MNIAQQLEGIEINLRMAASLRDELEQLRIVSYVITELAQVQLKLVDKVDTHED